MPLKYLRFYLLVGVLAVFAIVLCKVAQWITIVGPSFQSIGLALLDKMRNVSLFVAATGVLAASVVADTTLRVARAGGHPIDATGLWKERSDGSPTWRRVARLFAVVCAVTSVALMVWAWTSGRQPAGWFQAAPEVSKSSSCWVLFNRVEQALQVLIAFFAYYSIALVFRITSYLEFRARNGQVSAATSRMANEAFFAVTLAVMLNPLMCSAYFFCRATANDAIQADKCIAVRFQSIEYADTATSIGCFGAYWLPFVAAWLWMWWRYANRGIAPSLAGLVRDFWRRDLSSTNDK
ncbi:MAG: hypothetical protein SFY96_04735 [Planctomycetota bacterium]|nr:hypothetical protein [Planctomycetota bacterium]